MGVCGTDVSRYLGKFPFFDYPRIGHELGVEVLAVGDGVENVRPATAAPSNPTSTAAPATPAARAKATAAKTSRSSGS